MFFNRKKAISAVEFGRLLMSTCDKFSITFLESYKNRDDIDELELTIAHMWVVYHLINVKLVNSTFNIKCNKSLYLKVITSMNTSLVKRLNLSNDEADILIETLMKRYNEYCNGITSDKNKKEVILPDWATAIVKNITGKLEPVIDVIMITMTTIHFNTFTKMINDLINKQFKVV
jgi:hypothetical protein